ncbi:MAG: hypothetical protein HRT58_00185 [Crocinitomicaceae bacterium]|nr:hypothetical protein [Flavobacteriales bacterium]NQZ34038.1 hypothetical protein [Crocinitomicaceae bacterium]
MIEISKLDGISFTHVPMGIYISRGYKSEAYNEIQKNHRTHFNLFGLSAYHINKQSYIPLKLNYCFGSLTRIEVDEPEKFHKNFDLDNLQINEMKIEALPNENPNKKTVEKILKALTKEQKDSLELEDTFEIELDEKLYYTILDMENGNYVAVDKLGNVYRLNHDHKERIRKIASKPTEFFKLYKGDKNELEQLMEE